MSFENRLRGKHALVTGATSGLGLAIAERLASEGAHLVITGRRVERLERTATALRARGVEVLPLVCDHTVSADNATIAARVKERFGRLEVAVMNAGVIGFDGVLDPKPDTFRRLLEVDLVSVYEVLTGVTPLLVESAARGAGASIVNVSSVASLRPYPGLLGYCTAKAAVDMLTQSAAIELAPHKVRVNAVNPGVVVTELHTQAGLDAAQYAAFLERSKATHPLGRPGEAHEVASLVAFLASDEAAWITGGLHSIDGGRALTSLR